MSNIYISEPTTRGKAVLVTNYGDLDVELWSKEAPLACRNFLQHAIDGYFDGCIFHRVIKGFIVQTGDPTNTGLGGESIYETPFKDEFHQRLKFTRRGLLAMANSGPNDNRSQFFITLDRCDSLNKKNTIFGKVTGDTIYNLVSIGEVETDKDDRPIVDVVIKSIEVLYDPFEDIAPRVVKTKFRTGENKESQQKRQSLNKIKDKNLLSFGEEPEDETLILVSKKIKSSHELLEDSTLSKEPIQLSSFKEFDQLVNEVPLIVPSSGSLEKEESKDDKEQNEFPGASAPSIPPKVSSSKKKKEVVIKDTSGSDYLSQQKVKYSCGKNAKYEQNKKAEAMLEDFRNKLSSQEPTWLTHKLEFVEEENTTLPMDPSIDKIEERYDLHDPRHPLNRRRRENSKKKMELFKHNSFSNKDIRPKW